MGTDKLASCMVCPTCKRNPVMTIEDDPLGHLRQDVVLRCEAHGLVALGDTLAMAIRHWNVFVTFTIHQAGKYWLANGAGKPNESYCSVCGDYSETEDFPDRKECKRCHAVKLWKEDAA